MLSYQEKIIIQISYSSPLVFTFPKYIDWRVQTKQNIQNITEIIKINYVCISSVTIPKSNHDYHQVHNLYGIGWKESVCTEEMQFLCKVLLKYQVPFLTIICSSCLLKDLINKYQGLWILSFQFSSFLTWPFYFLSKHNQFVLLITI